MKPVVLRGANMNMNMTKLSTRATEKAISFLE